MKSIAALMTCHNRKALTLRCLHSLFACELPDDVALDVFLVDDGSSDGTGDAIASSFPSVNVIRGGGDLYWSGGMRLAWDTAAKTKSYDGYLWVNDDVVLEPFAIRELFNVAGNPDCAPVGAVVGCFSDSKRSIVTYGGRTQEKFLIPNGKPQRCRYMHGNFVFVPRSAYEMIGGFPSYLRHGLGDTEFGFRARKHGLGCWITSRIVGICEINKADRRWFEVTTPFFDRWRLYWSIKGAGGHELYRFRRRYHPFSWLLLTVMDIVHVIFPYPMEFIVRRQGRSGFEPRMLDRSAGK